MLKEPLNGRQENLQAIVNMMCFCSHGWWGQCGTWHLANPCVTGMNNHRCCKFYSVASPTSWLLVDTMQISRSGLVEVPYTAGALKLQASAPPNPAYSGFRQAVALSVDLRIHQTAGSPSPRETTRKGFSGLAGLPGLDIFKRYLYLCLACLSTPSSTYWRMHVPTLHVNSAKEYVRPESSDSNAACNSCSSCEVRWHRLLKAAYAVATAHEWQASPGTMGRASSE